MWSGDYDFTRKTIFFVGCSWFRFNRPYLFYTSVVAKGLKLKVRKFWWVMPMFVEVTFEKLVWGLFDPPYPE